MKSEIRVAVVLLAAGFGTRFGHTTNKVWLPLNGRTIISRSLTNASKNFKHVRIILVINPSDVDLAREIVKNEITDFEVEIIDGGSSRHGSEFQALTHLAPQIESGEIEVVLIHDGARPLATPSLFVEIAETALRHGGAIPTILVDPREMDAARSEVVVRVQTPQGFVAPQLLAAYRSADADQFIGTDTAACMEQYFPKLTKISVPGDVFNIKVTYPQDLQLAEVVLERVESQD